MADTPQLDKNCEYAIRLKNGDILCGFIGEYISDSVEGEGIKFKTELGTAPIYFSQVAEIIKKEDLYRHNHRIFLLPTAEPVGSNYFAGSFEMLLLYAGGGIGNWFSCTLGHTFIPGIASNEQLSLINLKFTLSSLYFDDVIRKLSLAAGGNLGFANHDNRFIHFYGVSTISLTRTNLTASIFYKAGSGDFYTLHFAANEMDVSYADGSFGLALGMDSKLPERNDLHVIGEIWNSDISKPTHTGIFLGLRLCNTSLAADFGLSLFTQPLAVPFFSFVWTPF